MGGGLTNTLDAPIDPSTFEPETSTTAHGTASTKTGDTTTSTTVSETDDGTVTTGFEVEKERSVLKVGDDAASSEVTLTRAESGSKTVHPDGTITYTFGASVGMNGETQGEVRGVEAGVEGSAEATSGYSVTLPPGSTIDDALAVNPFDPTTIPQGGSVTITNSLAGEVGGSLGYKDVVTGSASLSGSEQYVTTVAHTEGGTFTVDQGPGSVRGINYGLQIGPDQANVTIEGGWGTKETVVSHAEFENSEAGRAGFTSMVTTGNMPPAGAEGVVDQFTDTIRSQTDSGGLSVGGEGDAGEWSAGVSQESATVYDVTREYADGSWVREERAGVHSPGGSGDEPYGVRHTSSAGEPEYELRYTVKGSAAPTSFHDKYDVPWSTEDQQIRVSLTQAEMDQIMENTGGIYSNENTGGLYANELEALRTYAGEGPDGARRMAAEYSGVPVTQGAETQPGIAPGVTLEEGESPEPGQRGASGGGTSSGGTVAIPSAR